MRIQNRSGSFTCTMPSKEDGLAVETMELIAGRFRVLAEPIRLGMLDILSRGEMSVSHLAETIGSTQPNISKHLKILQEAGIVGRRPEGNTVYYFIADSSVFQLCELVCGSLDQQYSEKTAAVRRFKGPGSGKSRK